MERLRVWLKWSTIRKALEAFLMAGDIEHQRARDSTGEQAKRHRAEAEDFYAAKKDFWESVHALDPPREDRSIRENSAPVQVTRVAQKVDISERTLSIIAFGFAIGAFVIALWANVDNGKLRDEVLKSERESRVLQQQVMDQSALLLREGIRQPGDLNNGPAGNLGYQRKEK